MPGTVDVTDSDGKVGMVTHVTDDATGFSFASVVATCVTCTGTPPVLEGFDSFQAGSAADKTVTLGVRVPQSTPAGTWQISRVTLSDEAGHDRTYVDGTPGTDEEAFPGFSTTASRQFNVTKTPDSVPPSVATAPAVSPSSLNVTTADGSLEFTVGVTDTFPGVDPSSVVINAHSATALTGDLTVETDLVKGNVLSGTYRGSYGATLQDVGHWAITSVDAKDADGNLMHMLNPGGGSAWPDFDVTVDSVDTGKPALGATTLAPTTDGGATGVSSAGPDTLTATLHVTDGDGGAGTGSGLLGGSATFQDSTGHHIGFAFGPENLTTGNTRDGVYIVPVDVQPKTPAGHYVMTALELDDRAGNSLFLGEFGDGPVPSLAIDVSSTSDAQIPTIDSLQVSPTLINTISSPNRGPIAYVHVNDGTGDFDHGVLSYDVPNSATILSQSFDRQDRVSGTVHAGLYRVLLPSNGSVGTYHLTSADLWSVKDAANLTPTMHMTTGDLTAIPSSVTSFTTESTQGDSAAPVISSIDVTPVQSVDASAADQTLKVRVTATDADGAGVSSGIDEINLHWRSPTGVQFAETNDFCFANFSFSLSCSRLLQSGDDTNGVYEFTVTVPRYAENGGWLLDSASVSDAANHSTFYSATPDSLEQNVSTIGGDHHGFNVVSPGDTTAPSILGLTFDPTPPVPASDGKPFTVSGTMHLSDQAAGAVSGVQSGFLEFTSPSGKQFASTDDVSLLSGPGSDPVDGTWRWQAQFPRYAETGDWKIDFDANDNAGNDRSLSNSQLATAGLPSTLHINGQPDTIAPALSTVSSPPAFALDRTSVDVSTQAQTVVATIHATDDKSGLIDRSFFNAGVVVRYGLAGSSSKDVTRTAQLVGGNATDSWFQVGLNFQPFVDVGNWVIKEIDITDEADNVATITDLTGFDHTITASGPPDTTAPTASSLGATPTRTDVTSANATVNITAALADTNGSGVDNAQLDVTRPDNSVFSVPLFLASGTPQSGTWGASFVVPRFTGVGTWHLGALHLEDVSGNPNTYQATSLGAPGTLTFTGTQDVTKPQLTSVALSPTTVNINGAPGETVATIQATDDVSGISFGSIVLSSPSGFQGTDAHFSGVERTDGTATNGTYTVHVPIPRDAEPGTWTVSDVTLVDVAGNDNDITGGLLPAGSTSAITVNAPTPVFDGVINGHVTTGNGATNVVGAPVEICSTTSFRCALKTTDASGQYSATNLPDAVYSITVSAPAGSSYNAAESALTATLYSFPSKTKTVNFDLVQPAPLPSGATINGISTGVPSAFFGSPISLTAVNCANGTGAYTITMEDGTILTKDVNNHSGVLTESPAGSGHYAATIPAPSPAHGTATVKMEFTCPGVATPVTQSFTLYIDPSGFVKDTHGGSISGATVTLFRSDTVGGTFTQVPNGDATMSPANRSNPDSSDATGHYGWDVTAGFYKVTAAKTDCYKPGSYVAGTNSVTPTYTSPVQQIPPAVTDLTLTLDCTNIAPVASFTQDSNAPVKNVAVNFNAGASKDANGSVVSYAWDFGDGKTATGATVSHVYTTNGTFTPKLTVTDDQGLASSQVLGHAIVSDLVGPIAGIVKPSSTTSLTKSFAVQWNGSDATGVTGYNVRYTKAAWNGKPGAPVVWKSKTLSTSATFAGALGYEYCFSSQAFDAAGNVSGWSAAKCTALPLDDRALTASAGWKKLTGKNFLNSTAMQALAKGKTLTKKGAIAGRAVLYVDKGKGFGSVVVLYNGKVVKTISLAATKALTKVAVALPKVTKATTIVIKTASAKTVQIDGLLLARV